MNQLRRISPSKKLPLVVLHKNRVTGGPAQHPNNRKLLEGWRNAGALYATPVGSNDDWYLLVNDLFFLTHVFFLKIFCNQYLLRSSLAY